MSLSDLDLTITNFCPHGNKYPFKYGTKLEEYMRQCKGWLEDQDRKYTINYILIVLLAEIKSRRLLILDAYDKYYIICDRELQLSLGVSEPFIEITLLRKQVLSQMRHTEYRYQHERDYKIPFWCVRSIDSVLLRIFDNLYECRSSIVADYCFLE